LTFEEQWVPEMGAVDKARLAIAELLGILGIARVYCVDDFYLQRWTVDDVLGGQRKLSPEQLLGLMPQIGNVPGDEDVRRETVRRAWEELNSAQRAELADRIMALAEPITPETENDAKAASRLQELIGEERLTELAPDAWEKNEPQALEAAAKAGVLVLFDQDLTQAGGSATGGMALVKNLLGKDTSGKLMCGLLTHTASKENQHRKWEQYADEAGVDRHRFVLVAKEWLIDDPLGFARMLKLVALAPDCSRMKQKGKAILESVTEEAAEGIEKLSVFDFDHIVFRLSHQEGIWETDMLFRLYTILQRPTLRQKAYGDTELNEIIRRLRSVSLIPTAGEGSGAPERTSWDLQQHEMYEDGNHINSLHLPIEVGDIFERTDGASTRAFILLGQPCDLMVRSGGQREPEISDVLLTEIVQEDPSAKEKPLYCEKMEYYGNDPQAVYYVKFRRTHFVNPCVLDLCVFDSDGVARIDLASECPRDLLPGWTKRYELLKKRAARILQKYQSFGHRSQDQKATPEALRAAALFPPTIGNSRVFKATVELTEGGGRIVFNCRRAKRLCRPRALALTVQYVSCFTRPAFDLELGRRVRDD
jgi:hypothetical protein